MSVKIRLAKTGKKHQISYRIVAQDSHAKRDGRFLEILGYYNPNIKNSGKNRMKIDMEKIRYWISKGAKPSEAVAKLIRNNSLNANGLTTNAEKIKAVNP